MPDFTPSVGTASLCSSIMKTKTKVSQVAKTRKKRSAGKVYSKELGQIAVLYNGGSDNTPRSEWGPCTVTHDGSGEAGAVRVALAWASGVAFEMFGVDVAATAGGKRVLLFTPGEITGQRILRSAAGSEGTPASDSMELDDLVTARKNLKLVQTELRGREFLDYVRRMVDIVNPKVVVIWPRGFYLDDETPETADRLLSEVEFGTPKPKRDPKWDPSKLHQNDEPDSGDWWKSK